MRGIKRIVAAGLAAVTLMSVGAAALADYGDADKDKGTDSRYKVGQYVEVYTTDFHVTTKRHKVIQAGKNPEGVWEYIVDSGHGRIKNVSADQIESK